MRLLHVSDLHIGKMINGYSMLKEQKHILDQIASILQEEQAEGILLAGDIYDRPVPSGDSVKVWNDFLTKINRTGAKLFLISGNHDSPERMDFAGELLEKQGIFIAGEWTREIKRTVLEDAYGKINIYLLPFARPAMMNKIMETQCATYTECLAERIRQMALKKDERNILVTHYFVTNAGKEPKLCDSETAVSVGGLDNVEAEVFQDFDYVALGHIHGSQWIGRETIRYSGSVLKYSFSEVFHHKSVTVVELREKGQIEIRERELSALHDMRKIKGELEALLEESVVSAADCGDYLHVTLTNREELVDPMASLRSAYPNVMQLELEKNKRMPEVEYHASRQRKNKTPGELFREFYEAVSGYTLDEERKKIIDEIVEKIQDGIAEPEGRQG